MGCKCCRSMVLSVFLGALLALGAAAPIMAQQRYYYAMLVDGAEFTPNVIYAVNATTGEVEAYSNRILDALSAYQVEAESISMGLDGTDYIDQHGMVLYSVASVAAASTLGVRGSAIFQENWRDLQSDIYGVPHKSEFGLPASPSLNIKVMEENSGALPPVSNWYLPLPSFGLEGGFTGLPKGPNPPDLKGVDYHLAPARAPIYFTVNERFTDSEGQTYYPSDILYVDTDGGIECWRRHGVIGLHPADQIDALSLCLNPAPGVQPNAILSLASGSPSCLASPILSPIRGGDLLLFVDNPEGSQDVLSMWRDEAANGLNASVGPEIDGVVSIDPKRFVPGSRWRGSEPGISPQGVEVSYLEPSQQIDVQTAENWGEIEPTVFIEWDFELMPLGQGQIPLDGPLQPGDEVLAVVHFLDDGVPKSHYEVVSIDETLTSNPASDLHVVAGGSQVSGDITLATSPPPFDKWEVTVDRGTPVLLDSSELDFLESLPGDPGLKTIELRGLDTSFGKRSLGLHEVVFLDSSAPPPTDLVIELIGDSHVKVDWSPASPTAVTEVKVSGAQDSNSSLPATLTYVGLPPHTFFVGNRQGYHGVTLRTVTNTSRSLPVEGSFFTGVRPELRFSRSLPATINAGLSEPGDLALEDSTARLVFVPRTPGDTFWTIDTLDHNGNASPVPHQLPSSVLLYGVTNYFENYVSHSGLEGVNSYLVFAAISDSNPKLLIVESEDPWHAVAEIDVVFPTPPSELGAIAMEPKSNQLLLVADEKLYWIEAAQLLQASSVLVNPVGSLAYATVAGVSCRAAGFYEVPVSCPASQGLHTHLLTLAANHEVVGALELDSPSVIHGLVHAHDPLPTTYLSLQNKVLGFEMPKQLQPASAHSFSVLATPLDLNGDGEALDIDDWNLFVTLVPLWTNAGPPPIFYAAVDSPAAWDVDGSLTSFPGDGQLDWEDLFVIWDAFQSGVVLDPILVPVHPVWASEPVSGCP